MVAAFISRHGSRVRESVVSRGGHPLPDAESFRAGSEALRIADANRERGETLVVLLSGGASAMLAAPAEGVTRDQKIATTRALLSSGRPIAEMNAVRKRLSAIKGGKLAVRAARSITFALSDVHAPIEDDPSVIGSGPTFLERPSPGVDARFVLVGSRRDAMKGAREEAAALGYRVVVIDPPVAGEAREAAAAFAAAVAALSRRATRPLCVIASGETTVRLPAHEPTGRGGRNQEFALAFALERPPLSNYSFTSIGTDGIDGPTDAAGAIVDHTTLDRAQAARVDLSASLRTHDAYAVFDRIGDLVNTGPTGTNVGDLQVLLVSSPEE
jgi:glycerate-2-kinase